jgi:hypothetical protein
MSKKGEDEKPAGTPPGHFISEDLRVQTARFLEELRQRLRRDKADEPKLRLRPPQ